MMWIQTWFSLVSLSFASQVPLQASLGFTSPFDEKFAGIVNQTLKHFHVPGMSISVLYGSYIYAEGYGFAALPDTPATADSLYYTASTTKALTAAAVSLLVDEGKLNWTSPISSIIPDEFVLADDYATKHVTFEDTISHRTGLPRHDLIYRTANSTEDLVRKLRYLPMSAEIRTTFQYCNIMYSTVGYAVSQLAKQSLEAFLSARIWEPLGMTGTFFSVDKAEDMSLSWRKVYYWNASLSEYVEIPKPRTTIIDGAGATISNVRDYAKWLRMMMHRETPLSKEGHAALMIPRSMAEAESEGTKAIGVTGDMLYSLGWFRFVYGNELVIMHNGDVSAFGATVLYLPHKKWGFAAFGNSIEGANQAGMKLAWQLMNDLLNVPEAERAPWDALFAKQAIARRKRLENSLSRLYPDIPSPPVPHALPLKAYCGTYSREAYGSLDLVVAGEDLHLVLDSDLMSFDVVLAHVSSECWLATLTDKYTGETLDKVRAEFKLSDDGPIIEFGVAAEPVLAATGEMIWFPKALSNVSRPYVERTCVLDADD